MCSSSPSADKRRSLLNPRFDHESCGVGFVATLHSSPSHEILRLALTALSPLAHRGAVSADGKSSDGVGVLTAVPRSFLVQQAALRLSAEPWDGPSALVFTDGRLLGAVLDRNGLRPCRYVIRDDGLIVAGSEFGLADVHPDAIIRSGRLGPGQMMLLDLAHGKLLEGEELDRYFDAVAPYATLIDDVPLIAAENPAPTLDSSDLLRLQSGFGYRREEVKDGYIAHGAGGQRGRLVDERRHSNSGAGQHSAATLWLLPAALCPSDQPAHRFPARALRGFAADPLRTVAAPARQTRAAAGLSARFALPVARTNGRTNGKQLSFVPSARG